MVERRADPPSRRVLLIDRRGYRLWEHCRALKGAGFEVTANCHYSKWTLVDLESLAAVDLVVLICTEVGAEELELVRELSHAQHRPLVLSLLLGAEVMRALFLEGALDVAALPSRPQQLGLLAKRALKESAAPPQAKRLLLAGAR